MDCYQIHETVIRDVVDVLTDVHDSVENNGGVKGIFSRSTSFKSISSASSNMVLVFPVAVSRSVNIENAAMVTKAIERKAVSMLQILFSAINIADTKNAMEYVGKFHNNLKIDGDLTVDGFMDAMDKFIVSQESNVEFIYNKELYEMIKEDMKNLNNVLPENISETSINNFKIAPQSRYGEIAVVREAKGDKSPAEIQNQMTQSYKNVNDVFKSQIIDSDIKKANELIPTTMIVNFVQVYEDTPINGSFLIGVKAKMYPVDSEDIINRIKLKNKDNNGFQKFIRATTREISFFKDFVFAIDQAKLDALSQSRKGSSNPLWKVLERRALKGKIRRTLGQINDASAITTLVVSQEEVEYLKKYENINIEDPKVIRGIMESYGFMCVCIVDESLEVSKFIFDTDEDVYEHLAFASLEREASDNTTKKLINLMSKANK